MNDATMHATLANINTELAAMVAELNTRFAGVTPLPASAAKQIARLRGAQLQLPTDAQLDLGLAPAAAQTAHAAEVAAAKAAAGDAFKIAVATLQAAQAAE